ncbi:type III secretion system protein [Escherichia coli]|uniref:Type III secretion system protein n=1 Tax=Escherichia coli TaxID=562 RepID=A0A376MIR1_ECOLX|nr:type III secretion system protein [Escherichia coli]
MFNKVLIGLRSHPELIILGLMVMIIAMLIIPLPTYLIDFLIGLNLTLAILVFLGSFYVDRILSFSSFHQFFSSQRYFVWRWRSVPADLYFLRRTPGEIITSFGEFVIGDSLVVGFVIFSIVTIVQFIVILKVRNVWLKLLPAFA